MYRYQQRVPAMCPAALQRTLCLSAASNFHAIHPIALCSRLCAPCTSNRPASVPVTATNNLLVRLLPVLLCDVAAMPPTSGSGRNKTGPLQLDSIVAYEWVTAGSSCLAWHRPYRFPHMSKTQTALLRLPAIRQAAKMRASCPFEQCAANKTGVGVHTRFGALPTSCQCLHCVEILT